MTSARHNTVNPEWEANIRELLNQAEKANSGGRKAILDMLARLDKLEAMLDKAEKRINALELAVRDPAFQVPV